MKAQLIILFLILALGCSDNNQTKENQIKFNGTVTEKSLIPELVEYFENDNFKFQIDTFYNVSKIIHFYNTRQNKQVIDSLFFICNRIVKAKGFKTESLLLPNDLSYFDYELSLIIEEISRCKK